MKKDYPDESKMPTIYIDEHWLTGKQEMDAAAKNTKLPRQYILSVGAKIAAVRKPLVPLLSARGFTVTHDDGELPIDAIYLTKYSFANNQEIAVKWKTEKDQKAARCCGEAVRCPASVTLDDFIRHPFYPAVFKSELVNWGLDKFLIERPEQLETIQRFRQEVIPQVPEYRYYFDSCLFQQFIETPAECRSSLRVFTSASGDVMAVGLIYSTSQAPQKTTRGTLGMFFSNPDSAYFLNSKSILSNRAAGGDIISFGAPRYSDEKRRILKAHGFDPANPAISDDLERTAATIAKECNKELGIICGIDFIYHAGEERWYFLEANHNPAVGTYAAAKGKKAGVDTAADYQLDLEARMEALRMCMIKR